MIRPADRTVPPTLHPVRRGRHHFNKGPGERARDVEVPAMAGTPTSASDGTRTHDLRLTGPEDGHDPTRREATGLGETQASGDPDLESAAFV